MANEQVLTAEQVIDNTKRYLSEEDVAFVQKHMILQKKLTKNNIASRVNHILSTRFKSQEF